MVSTMYGIMMLNYYFDFGVFDGLTLKYLYPADKIM